MKYQIKIRKEALKELTHLPARVNGRITTAIDQLSENPRPVGSKKLKGEKESKGTFHGKKECFRAKLFSRGTSENGTLFRFILVGTEFRHPKGRIWRDRTPLSLVFPRFLSCFCLYTRINAALREK